MAWHFSHRGADTVDCIGHASRRKQPKRLIQESKSYALLKLLKKIIKQPIAQKTALEFYTKCDWWNLLAVIQSHGILVKVWKRKVKLNNRTLTICKKTSNYPFKISRKSILHKLVITGVIQQWQGLDRDVH